MQIELTRPATLDRAAAVHVIDFGIMRSGCCAQNYGVVHGSNLLVTVLI